LAIDTHDGVAWIGITPFTMWGNRPVFAPTLPLLGESHELNVRTYVHLDGVPGVWFFSLDANNTIAVFGARLAFHLPYFKARMSLERQDWTSTSLRGAPTVDYRGRDPDQPVQLAPAKSRAALGARGSASITFHDLRHTCASLLFQRNIHPKFVQELLGHASVAITLDTYSHMLPGMGGEAATAMEDVLSQGASTDMPT